MQDCNAHDFDGDDRWGDCDEKEDEEEEEGLDILPNEGGGQLQTNDSGRVNNL